MRTTGKPWRQVSESFSFKDLRIRAWLGIEWVKPFEKNPKGCLLCTLELIGPKEPDREESVPDYRGICNCLRLSVIVLRLWHLLYGSLF